MTELAAHTEEVKEQEAKIVESIGTIAIAPTATSPEEELRLINEHHAGTGPLPGGISRIALARSRVADSRPGIII